MRNHPLITCAAGVLMAAAIERAQGAAPQTARPAFTIETLKPPAAGDSSAPQMTVGGGKTILSWLDRAGDKTTLKFAERLPAGWSTPIVVVTSEHVISNFADVPSVSALADGSLLAHWIEMNGPDPEAYDLKISSSRDGGKTWSALGAPGFHTLSIVRGSRVVWAAGEKGAVARAEF